MRWRRRGGESICSRCLVGQRQVGLQLACSTTFPADAEAQHATVNAWSRPWQDLRLAVGIGTQTENLDDGVVLVGIACNERIGICPQHCIDSSRQAAGWTP